MIICFYALEFQRRVMEMLIGIREDIRSLKSGVGSSGKSSNIPEQATSVAELNTFDSSLDSLEDKQKLVR